MSKDYTSSTQAEFYAEQERLSKTRELVLLRPAQPTIQLVRKEAHPDGMAPVIMAYDSPRTRELAATLGYEIDARSITDICASLPDT